MERRKASLDDTKVYTNNQIQSLNILPLKIGMVYTLDSKKVESNICGGRIPTLEFRIDDGSE